MAIGLASKLLHSLLQFCIAGLLCSLTISRTAVMRQLQQACDSLLIRLGIRNLSQGWDCKGTHRAGWLQKVRQYTLCEEHVKGTMVNLLRLTSCRT